MSLFDMKHPLMEEAPGDGDGGGGGPETPPAAPPATPPETPPATPPETPPAAESWIDQLPDDVKGYVQQKGFEGPAALAQSYQNLEKLVGVPEDRLLKLPDKEDAEGWARVYNQLGRPKDPDGYEIKRAEGMDADADYEAWVRKTGHELGFTPEQLNGLVQKLDERVKEHMAETAAKQEQDAIEVTKELRKEWGAAFDEKWENVDRIADRLGFTEEQLKGLKDAMGPVEAMKFVDNLGSRLGEDALVGGGGSGGGRPALGALPPDAAKAEIQQLTRDVDFAARLQKGDVDAKRRWDQLHEWAYPE